MLDLSMMALLLGLFSTDLLAKDMSAVTLVMDILQQPRKHTHRHVTHPPKLLAAGIRMTDAFGCLLTSRQTCASGSQTALSASCLSPRLTNEEEGAGEKG